MSFQMVDASREYMLDGNAAAGILMDIFSLEMTASPMECAQCGQQGEIGALLAFIQSPGIVLRCPACQNVVMRIVRTPGAIYLDARGAAFLCLKPAISVGVDAAKPGES